MKSLSFVILLLTIFTTCVTKPEQNSSFLNAFKRLETKDTLRFAVAAGEGTEAASGSGDTIATDTFYRYVPDRLRVPIAHILEGGDPVVVSLGRFPLDAQVDGLGVDIKAFWYRNQSILLYNKRLQKVVGLVPVAEFYGGDGGQILRQSWLISAKNNPKELIVRASEHTMKLIEATQETEDIYTESVTRYHWQNGSFVQQPASDSTALMQRFPVKWE